VTPPVAITIDVDGEAGLPGGGSGYDELLSSRSERLYGIRRGLPRVLAVLEEAGAEATFFIPGVTAERHPEDLGGIAEAGHEIAHHGHTHLRLDAMSDAAQAADLDAGIAALAALTGSPPRGYRAPCWELTRCTLRLLGERGFAYDSSLMGDDRPYAVPAGPRAITELPVHWTLDDAPHFATSTDPDALTRVWCGELAAAVREGRPVTLTLHPEILGRAHRLDVLRRVLDAADALGCAVEPLGRIASAHAGEERARVDAECARQPDDGRKPGVAHSPLEP
jgi:peptidoglycan/xylan/chitin deacetylase (PgdA/CDA1 family)